jgi:2-oxoglutarate dehydrogenase E2 component (dihydrolipoamide succinyltransferase)
MATKVEMPQMGESVVEGTILTWLKKEGDAVEVDEPLVEVSTDKVDTEIPSPVAGTLVKILVQEGETVEIGTALAEVDESGEGAASADAKAEKDSPAETPEEQTEKKPDTEDVEDTKAEAEEEPAAEEPAPAKEERPAAKAEELAEAPESKPKAAPAAPAPARAAASAAPSDNGPGQTLSPIVRRLAREHNIDIAKVRGTGAGGRVTRDDVLAYVESGAGAAPAQAPTDGKAAAAAAPAAAAQRISPPPTRESAGGRTEVQPVTHIRKRIAEHMLASLSTSARAWNAIEVDMEEIARLRAKVGEDFRRREGFSLTYLPFISRAVCDALLANPIVNASMSEDLTEATYHNYVNLGIAVATDYGLIVPVIKGAEALNIVGLARAIRDLGERARDKKLQPDDVGGSTFSVTNPGPFGSYLSLPVINQPNVAILSTEIVEKRVVVMNDMIGIRHRTFLSMSWDHRLLDGADAMRFLQRLKENLETWDFSRDL